MLTEKQLYKLYWEEQKSVPEIAEISGFHKITIYEWMAKYGLERRSGSECNYLVNRDKPLFKLRKRLSKKQEKLRMAGLMLYWGEGAKRQHTVDLANSDPRIIFIFLRFLREVCGVAESRLRVFLYVYEGQNVHSIRRYWNDLTGIPVTQFLKPYVSRLRPDRARRGVMPYGVVHIRYNDKRLLEQLLSWIEEEAFLLNSGAGTQVAKRVRL